MWAHLMFSHFVATNDIFFKCSEVIFYSGKIANKDANFYKKRANMIKSFLL